MGDNIIKGLPHRGGGKRLRSKGRWKEDDSEALVFKAKKSKGDHAKFTSRNRRRSQHSGNECNPIFL
jgi:hypothetical protein